MGSKVADTNAQAQAEECAKAPKVLGLAETYKLSQVKCRHEWLNSMRFFAKCSMENSYLSALMTFITLYALFGNDLRLSVTDTSSDRGFIVCAWLCIALFLLEIMFNSFAFDHYFGSFYFWIDIVSTLSILSEIPIVLDNLSSVLSGERGSTTEMMRAGKAGRVGTRASRIIRIVRLVRMVRVVKLYKMHNANEALVDDTLEATQVGKKLTEVTTRRLILMMLTMIMVLPWLHSSSLVANTYNFHHNFLRHLHQYPQNYNATGNISEGCFRNLVTFYVKKSLFPVLYLEVCEPQVGFAEYVYAEECNTTWSHGTLRRWARDETGFSGKFIKEPRRGLGKDGVKGSRRRAMSVAKRTKHRASEILISSHVGCYVAAPPLEFYGGLKLDGPTGGGHIDREERDYRQRYQSPTCLSVAVFSIRRQERLLSGLAILKTLFIMLVLVYASVEFNRDAQAFVIGPIERMMTLIKRLSENPLDSANLDSSTYLNVDKKKVRDQGYETILLEQTLERIGQLLQVGFGAAGAEIIGKNMNSGSGKLNPMIAGKKITAIYGFCDIRQFTDTTECLQEEVMVYVNKLGNLVHTVTHSYYGMANKNVGDAFLLSWKICDGSVSGFTSFTDEASETQRNAANESILCHATNGSARMKRQITPSQLADAAITAFLKCQIELENENEDGCLTCYAAYDAVVRRFGLGFKIEMGFGMHVGWAIEGAIGSDLKIDATYLSPHVEMSDRLEAASKIFKAKLNLSHWLVNLATPDLKKEVRAIAHIRCDGVPVPFIVYTFDVTNNDKDFGSIAGTGDEKSKSQHIFNWNKAEYKRIQRDLHPDFRPTFVKAFTKFIAGDWTGAKSGFKESLALKGRDGPSEYLINFMASRNDIVPANWDGTHYLGGF